MAENIQTSTESNRNKIASSLTTPNKEEYLTQEQADQNFDDFFDAHGDDLRSAMKILEGERDEKI